MSNLAYETVLIDELLEEEHSCGSDGYFKCYACGHEQLVTGFNTPGDPTNNAGACRVCGSANWKIEEYQEDL